MAPVEPGRARPAAPAELQWNARSVARSVVRHATISVVSQIFGEGVGLELLADEGPHGKANGDTSDSDAADVFPALRKTWHGASSRPSLRESFTTMAGIDRCRTCHTAPSATPSRHRSFAQSFLNKARTIPNLEAQPPRSSVDTGSRRASTVLLEGMRKTSSSGFLTRRRSSRSLHGGDEDDDDATSWPLLPQPTMLGMPLRADRSAGSVVSKLFGLMSRLQFEKPSTASGEGRSVRSPMRHVRSEPCDDSFTPKPSDAPAPRSGRVARAESEQSRPGRPSLEMEQLETGVDLEDALAPFSDQAAASMEQLAADLGQQVCVCIVGGLGQLQDSKSTALVRALAKELSEGLGSQVCFMTCGLQHKVPYLFAEGCADGVKLWNLVPAQHKRYDVPVATNVNVGDDEAQCLEVFSELGDVYLTVEGGQSVADLARKVHKRGALVIPLIRSGRASAGELGFPGAALERPSVATEAQWELLASSDVDVMLSAAAVGSIIARLLEIRQLRRLEEEWLRNEAERVRQEAEYSSSLPSSCKPSALAVAALVQETGAAKTGRRASAGAPALGSAGGARRHTLAHAGSSKAVGSPGAWLGEGGAPAAPAPVPEAAPEAAAAGAAQAATPSDAAAGEPAARPQGQALQQQGAGPGAAWPAEAARVRQGRSSRGARQARQGGRRKQQAPRDEVTIVEHHVYHRHVYGPGGEEVACNVEVVRHLRNASSADLALQAPAEAEAAGGQPGEPAAAEPPARSLGQSQSLPALPQGRAPTHTHKKAAARGRAGQSSTPQLPAL